MRESAECHANIGLMTVLRGDLPRLARATSIMTASASSPIKRSKPLKYAYEKEIVLYAHHKKLDYFSTECIYSPEAFRGSARALIKNLERIRPSAILDVVRSGEDMARCVPPEAGGSSGHADATQGEVPDDVEEPANSCGSANGRGSGGEMADMERQLRENESAETAGREVDVTNATSPQGQRHRRQDDREETEHQSVSSAATGKLRGPAKTVKKLSKQQMGQCERCGYLSSQAVCKACMLLEGLNRNRPKLDVEVGAEEEDASSTLMRSMERVSLTGIEG